MEIASVLMVTYHSAGVGFSPWHSSVQHFNVTTVCDKTTNICRSGRIKGSLYPTLELMMLRNTVRRLKEPQRTRGSPTFEFGWSCWTLGREGVGSFVVSER